MVVLNVYGLFVEDKFLIGDVVLIKVVEILLFYIISKDVLVYFNEEVTLFGDLFINLVRLIDIVFDFESEFDIVVDDD